MRKTALTLLTFILSVPLFAADKHQSYFAYDDGGTIVKQADDGREIDARVNMPVYPGDEVVTNRRGRAEIRLSDGNVLGIDRATSVYFRSILDSYEGDADQTVAELRYGKIAIHRTELGREAVRLDTNNASYVATHETVYSVETDSRGRDRVLVLDGAIEVRTRNRATRLRSGEGAEVDDRGVYDLISDTRVGADDFERWFLKRAERRGGTNHRYLDRRLGYWADDLDGHGSWVQVSGIGWSWRPHVAVGWRPYYHGEWISSRSGCLTWVSYDPFGFLPYHYGRWAYDPFHGWVWIPGYGYSPAWVYWWYSPGYVGWAPAGLWDCHRGYYDWAYRPYARAGLEIGFGFYGRVRINEVDLRHWTFLDSNNIVSHRVDRAAITADAVKVRLGRSNGGFATVSNDPARFTREEFRDPAAAINRRAVRGGGGSEIGSPAADLTPFIRRDSDVGGSVRDRVVRNRGGAPGSGTVGTSTTPATTPRGGIAPIGGGGSVAPIGRGSVAPIGGGNVAPIGTGSGTVIPAPADNGPANRGGNPSRGDNGRINRGAVEQPVNRETAPAVTPAEPRQRSREESWRGRVKNSDPDEASPEPRRNDPPAGGETSWRNQSGESSGSDVPRRVIERSSGTRVTPREVKSDDSGRSKTTTRDNDSSRSSGRAGVSSPRSSGSGSSSGSTSRPSSGSSSGSSGSSGSSSRGSSSSGSNRSEGGKIKKD